MKIVALPLQVREGMGEERQSGEKELQKTQGPVDNMKQKHKNNLREEPEQCCVIRGLQQSRKKEESRKVGDGRLPGAEFWRDSRHLQHIHHQPTEALRKVPPKTQQLHGDHGLEQRSIATTSRRKKRSKHAADNSKSNERTRPQTSAGLCVANWDVPHHERRHSLPHGGLVGSGLVFSHSRPQASTPHHQPVKKRRSVQEIIKVSRRTTADDRVILS